MGAGSTTTSGRPTFRSGTIAPPPNVVATKRESITVKLGRDDAPITAWERSLPSETGTGVGGFRLATPRDNMATTIAKRSTGEIPVKPAGRSTSYAEVEDGYYRNERGERERTVDIGDAPLSVAAERHLARHSAAATANVVAKGKRAEKVARGGQTRRVRPQSEVDARKAHRDAEDAAILAYLRSLGYTGSKVSKDARDMAKDALAFAAQVAEYGRP